MLATNCHGQHEARGAGEYHVDTHEQAYHREGATGPMAPDHHAEKERDHPI